MADGIYVYGVIKTNKPQDFGRIGIGSQAPCDVLTIGVRDIAAVVSKRPLITYGTANQEDVIKDLVTHQYVIEQVMKRFTILPVKFGTMVATEGGVREFLEYGYTLLSDELSKAEGKIELDVVAWWELPKIIASLSQHNNQLCELERKIAVKGVKADTEDKIMLGRAIEQELHHEKIRCQQYLLPLLKQEAIDLCMHDLASDEMIFNAAFLLEKENEGHFHAAIQTGDQNLEGLVNFRVVGPLPLYSFSTILFRRLDPEKIEEAKKVLGLTGEITAETLRAAYYQAAKHHHPDVAGNEDSEEFQLIRDAHETLRDFVEHGWIYVEVCRWEKA